MTMMTIRGEVLSEQLDVDVATLIQSCQLQQQELLAMVEAGLLEPQGDQPTAWRFSGIDLRRARLAHRLSQDLGVNVEGAALIVDLLEERDVLRRQMRLLSSLIEEI